MHFGYFNYPLPQNEPVLNYAPGSKEREALKKAITELKNKTLDIPMYINGKEVRTNKKMAIHPPHEIAHTLGYFHAGDEPHVQQAIETALQAKQNWESMSWENRAQIYLKADELLSTKYRYQMNAATMLGQTKNVYHAEVE